MTPYAQTYLDFATGKATPKKARKFKKVASPLKKLSPVLEEEHVEKPKSASETLKESKLEQRVVVLEKELSQLKQVDYSAQLLEAIKSQIPAMVDAQLSTRLKDSIQKTFRSYTAEFKKGIR
ncbi:hypothetical protein Tco_0449191 [Tanacetum coccineum]